MVKNLPAKQQTWVRSLGWKIPWRRKWQPTPVILSGKSHGQRSLVGYSPWGYKRAKHNLTTKTAAAKSYTEVSKQVPTSFRLSFFISNPISQRCYEEHKEKCEVIHTPKLHKYGFPGGSAVKNSPTIQETRVRSLGLEDLL